MVKFKSMESEYFPLRGKVLVVEDDSIVGKWISTQLKAKDLEVTWVSTLEAARAELEKDSYHALIVDIYLSKSGRREGLELVREVEEKGIPVLVMSSHADLKIAKEALNRGAVGLLEKPFEAEELVKALNKAWLEPKGLGAAVDRFLDAHQLTPKEREITRLLLKGLSNKEIANVADTTEPTVKFYVSTIYDKCAVKSRTELFNTIFPT
ncbi:MAG: DNA-binding response regulator [Bradymonadales bacterium]|nr:MAG: DNA-binding response regulator [Bradymonadales bacterium]